MNTDWCDELLVFGPNNDFELPEHLPLEILDSPMVGVWCLGMVTPSMDADDWDYRYLRMYAVTQTGRAVSFDWVVSSESFLCYHLADLF